MQLATWNVNSLTVRLPQVLDWLAANPVDVLVLQETKMTDDKFPAAAFLEAGYNAQWFGQKTYNGVALLSKVALPVNNVVKNIPGFTDDLARVITATVTDEESGNSRDIRVIGAYFPNGQEPGSEKFDYKMSWLRGLRDWLKEELATHPNLVIMGDYNITFDDLDVWDPVRLEGTIHCTEEERYQLRALISLGLTDAVRLFDQPAKNYSWWDYRDFGFRKNKGLRIDHILVSNALKASVTACAIDKLPRKNERPSDHAPVVVTL
jgi:exodeoxyribonuclease III